MNREIIAASRWQTQTLGNLCLIEVESGDARQDIHQAGAS